jgi:hypothetical protein
MVIDIQPIEVIPSDYQRLVMEVCGHKELFYFTQDGKQHSVWWTRETIKDFLPNWCVSEYIENHVQRYASIFAHCMESWDKKVHPYWYQQVYYVEDESKRIPVHTTQKYIKDSASYWLKDSYKQFTKPLEFVVIKNNLT